MELLRDFLIPVLSGYTFLALSNWTRFRLRSYAGHRLLLLCAYGAPASRLLHEALPNAYSGLVTGPFFVGLAVVAGGISNCITSKEKGMEQAALASSDAGLYRFLVEAIDHHDLTEVSLRSDKVYIGVPVTATPGSGIDLDYIRIVPFMSGYRDCHQELVIASDYEWLYTEGNDTPPLRPTSDYEILVPTSEIVLMRLFDPLVYSKPPKAPPIRSLRFNPGLVYENQT